MTKSGAYIRMLFVLGLWRESVGGCGGILIDDSPLDLQAHPRSLPVCDGKMRSEGAASGTYPEALIRREMPIKYPPPTYSQWHTHSSCENCSGAFVSEARSFS